MAQPASPSVLSASRVMAAGTVVSRLTGLLRAVMLAAAIGVVGAHPDVFNVANTIPNSLYILVAGGVFNAVLVPQLVRAIKNDADGGDAYANRIIALGALVLAGVTVLLVALAPLLLRLLASSYFTDPAMAGDRASLIAFARWCLPQVFFYGMFVLIGQILNARGSFGPMMWAPIANNLISVVILAAYIVVYPEPGSAGYTTSQEVLLGLGSTIGIAAQTLILLPYLRATGFAIRPRFDFRGTGLEYTLSLAKWTVGFVVVNQIAFYVMVQRATAATAQAAGAAGYTVYANAFLLTQVPHSVVTVSLATATIPVASRLAAEGRLGELAVEMGRSLRLVLAVIVPFAVALAVLGPSLATVMFSWGAGDGDTTSLGTTMVAFAPGLLMFSVHYVLLRGFYAIEDNRTAFLVQCVVAAVNIAFAVALTVALTPRLAAVWLALAYGASYLVGALLSLRVLSRRLGGMDASGLARFVVRLATAAVPSAGAAYAVVRLLERLGLDVASRLDALVLLAGGGVAGIATYLAMARALHVSEVASILGTVRPAGADRAASHGRTGPRPTMGNERPPTRTSATLREAGPSVVAIHSVEPGTVLAERYALEDLLAEDGDATTWRARDRVLSRSVVLQVIPSSSPAAAEMLTAAKQASRVADARIIQVLDAVDDGELSFVVREWTNGQSLDVVLSEGPMSARKATFVLREVAGAISTAHRMGLRHRRLAPDTIVLTKSSGVKVLGLGTLAAARADSDEMDNPELADTRDLGRLLYASLTARWPGGPCGSLPAAPTEHGKLLRPRQVRAGVPRPLDILCDRILGNPPRGGEPIATVDEVKRALGAILVNDGFNESSSTRLSAPQTTGPPRQPEPPPAVLSHEAGGPSTGSSAATVPLPARRPVEQPPSSVRRTLLWSVVVVLAVGLLLLTYAIFKTLGGSGENTPGYVNTPITGGGSPGGTTPPGSGLNPIPVVHAQSFDPPPDGSGDENPTEVPLAIDGNPATTWNTLVYFSAPTFGSKTGVGLVLDLGSDRAVKQVKVSLVGSPTTLQLRAAPASAVVAPTGAVTDYPLLKTITATGTTASFTLDRPVSTRFLLVWLTSVPKVSGGYEGKVAEIQVLG